MTCELRDMTGVMCDIMCTVAISALSSRAAIRLLSTPADTCTMSRFAPGESWQAGRLAGKAAVLCRQRNWPFAETCEN